MYRRRSMSGRGKKMYVLVIGAIAIAVGIIMLFGSFSKLQTYEKTYATVTDTYTHRTHGRHPKTYKYAKLSYSINGQELNGDVEYKGSTKNKGDTMVIYCNPANPNHISGNYQMWERPLLLILCGAFCIIACFIFKDKLDG